MQGVYVISLRMVDQTSAFTGSRQEVVTPQVGIFNHPITRAEDFGDMILRGEHASGYIRVIGLLLTVLPTWGTGGYLSRDGRLYRTRKYIDLEGRPGGSHVFLVNQEGVQYIDCSQVELPYGKQLVDDIVNRTETAMTQEHCFLVSELCLKAEANAKYIATAR
jgi:hypothetical protein